MRTQNPEVVLVEDLAIRLGWSSEMVVTRAGDDFWLDALGRPVVASDVARRMVEEYEREQQERREDQAEYQAWSKAHEAKRREVYQSAFRTALEEARKEQVEASRKIASGETPSKYAVGGFDFPLMPGSMARARADQAAKQAQRDFDRKNPVLDFETWRGKRR